MTSAQHQAGRASIAPGPLLVTGASGYLGARVVRRALEAGWSVVGTHLRASSTVDSVRLDVRDEAAVRRLFAQIRPAAVVHTAYLAADWSTTAQGAAHVAAAAAAVGARVVHVSSDAIFAGRPHPYVEADQPEPIYQYGAAKAAAEVAVRALVPAATVVRTSLIIGDAASKQHQLALDLATGTVTGVLFTDMIRCPVAVDDLAAALLELVDRPYPGVVNVVGPEAVSRHELGRLVLRQLGLDPERLPAATMAERGVTGPGELRLDLTLAGQLLRTRLRGVSEVLAPARG